MKGFGLLLVIVLLHLRGGFSDPVYHELMLMWTEMAPDNRVQVVAIEGEPEGWIESQSPRIIGENAAPNSSSLYSSRIALGFNYAKQEVYWSDIGFKEIHKTVLATKDPKASDTPASLARRASVQKVYSGTSQEVNGLAVDWLSGSVYWTDALYNWISVASGANSEIHRQLVLTGLDKPMGLVLHPIKGTMYWSDWGAIPKIEAATLSGENRRTLLDTSLDRPLGLVIDFSTNDLFWVDDFLDTIDVLNLDTGSRRAFKTNEGNRPGPASYFSIALYENYLFVTDQLKKIIQVFNKTSAGHIQDIFLGRVPYDIIMYDQSQQKQISSECHTLKCHHMCVSTGQGKGHCICANGYHLTSDNRTCKASGGIRDPMFVYTIGKSICATPVNVPDREFVDLQRDVRCFLNGTGNAVAMAADVNGKSVFYSDRVKGTITRVRLTLEARTDIITAQTGDVKGLAVDWLSSNLYYTDNSYGYIMVSRLHGRYPTILCSKIGSPGGIALDPAKGKMYWIDTQENVIWAANMDCSNRRSLVQRAVGAEGIAIDLHERRLYWAQQSGLISVALDGTDKKTLIDDYGRTYKDVAIYQEYFAWSDGRNGIFFGEKSSGRVLRGFRHLEANVSHDIIGFSIYLQPVSEGGCDVKNGGCQQLCIPLPSAHLCRCALGFKLANDKKHCISDLVRGRFLLVADPYHKQVYQINLEGEKLEPQGLGLDSPEFPTAMDMDTVNEVIYWSDARAGVINARGLLDMGSERNILDFGTNMTVTSLVVDGRVGRIMFTLTDQSTGMSGLHVSDEAGHWRTILEPIRMGGGILALDQRSGFLFWSDMGNNGRWEIKRLASRTQDGNMETLLNDLDEIKDITVSYSENKLYWCSGQTIWRADMKGGDVEMVYTYDKGGLTGLAVVGDAIFLSIMNEKSLFRLTVSKNITEPVTEPIFASISNIKEYWRLPPKPLPPSRGKFDMSSTELPPNQNNSGNPTAVEGFLGTHVPMPIVIGAAAGNLLLLIIIILAVVCAIKKYRKKPAPPAQAGYGGPSHDNPTYVTTELATLENLYEGLPGATAGQIRDPDLPDIVTDKDGMPLEGELKAQPPPVPSPRSASDQAGPLPSKANPVVVSPSGPESLAGMSSFIFPSDQEQLVVDLPEEDQRDDQPRSEL